MAQDLHGAGANFLGGAGLSLEQVGLITAAYPDVCSIAQLLTSALSDRLGRKWLIAARIWVQATGIGLFVLRHSSSSRPCAVTILPFLFTKKAIRPGKGKKHQPPGRQ